MGRRRKSGNKRHKLSDESPNMASIDRLSALPDEVICHVLSFLTTKDSVATSVLARRWRFLWVHVPVLDLSTDYHYIDIGPTYTDIVDRVMSLHKSQTIDSFSIGGGGLDCGDDDLETWITNVVRRNVQNLDVYLNPSFGFMLPQSLFTCETLVDLRLCFCAFPAFSGAVSLPRLKILSLATVDYEVEETLPRLFSGCPVLEEVTIKEIRDRGVICLNISSTTIKRLTIEVPYFGCEHNYNPNCRVKINTPELRYLKVEEGSFELISEFPPVTSLSEAYINLNTHTLEVDYDLCTRKFFCGLSYVKRLHFQLGQHENEKDLDFGLAGSIVKFDNLTKLKLDAVWRFLPFFLENADNLQVLSIKEVHSALRGWVEPHQVPKCLSSHLRTVKIEVCGTEHEFELIRYLLRNAKVLERMKILYHYPYVDDHPHICDVLMEKLDMLRRITSFKRGSEECELIFR